MELCAVYLVNKQRASKIHVGTVMERRRTERRSNIVGLMKLAANRYLSLGQTIQIKFRGNLYEMEIRAAKEFRPE